MNLKAAFLISLLPLMAGATQRTLTDTQGRQIEVQILAKSADSILVVRSDGFEFEIPMSLLSEADQNFLKTWEAPEPDALDNVIDGVVIIQRRDGTGRGSGFFAHDGGRTFLYTNQHVIAGEPEFRAIDSRGQPITLGQMQISNSQDLVRFRVETRPAFFLEDNVSPSGPVKALGNSQGAGVVTIESGRVLGIGPQEIEVSSSFVPGNSGGPVIDENNKVIGVATYLRRGNERPNWVTAKTRYTETRRFTIRPTRVNDWRELSLAEYDRQYQILQQNRRLFEQGLWTFDVLANGTGFVSSLPETWHRDVLMILSNHNARQRRPDATRTTYYYDGIPINSQTRSHIDAKEASRRANLRALDTFLTREFANIRSLRGSLINIEYLIGGFNGVDDLDNNINLLRNGIQTEIELSMSSRSR
jgi:hypothetical protein